jgi:hypothetical protein
MADGASEISGETTQYLLEELCRTMGYCLQPEQKQRISKARALDAISLADKVLIASGFVPEHEKQKRRDIVESISHYLRQSSREQSEQRPPDTSKKN